MQYKPGLIEASAADAALVVHYVKETISMDDDGNVLGKEEENGTQAIKVSATLTLTASKSSSYICNSGETIQFR